MSTIDTLQDQLDRAAERRARDDGFTLYPERMDDMSNEENKGVTVADLIRHLQTFPQDLPVIHQKYSEQCLLKLKEVRVEEFCEHRPDGWVQDKRPDMPTRLYLCFPGN